MAIDTITVAIETDSDSRASEILADLRTVAETLYFPMKMVGFWDYAADLHLCPQEERRERCPHKLPTLKTSGYESIMSAHFRESAGQALSCTSHMPA